MSLQHAVWHITNLPSWHCRGMPESSGGSTTHAPWHRREGNVGPSQGITIHMLIPFSFYELKTMTGKGKVCIRARRLIRPALNSSFCSMKRLGILLLPPEWDASLSQGYPPPPSIMIAGTHLCTWVKRDNVK